MESFLFINFGKSLSRIEPKPQARGNAGERLTQKPQGRALLFLLEFLRVNTLVEPASGRVCGGDVDVFAFPHANHCDDEEDCGSGEEDFSADVCSRDVAYKVEDLAYQDRGQVQRQSLRRMKTCA